MLPSRRAAVTRTTTAPRCGPSPRRRRAPGCPTSSPAPCCACTWASTTRRVEVGGMSIRRSRVVLVVLSQLAVQGLWPVTPPPAARAQAVDVFLNVTGGGARKLNIAIPEVTVTTGADPTGGGKLLQSVAGADLTFSQLFSVVASTGAIPANNPQALEQSWKEFAAAGAHAGLHGLLALRGDRAEAEMRLYDLTSPNFRLIASKKF